MMRSFGVTALFVLFFVCGHAFANENKCRWDEDVKKWDGTQIELNQCAADKYEHADADMNDAYRKQMSYLTSGLEKSLLKKSQKAWLAYRDAACNYESSPVAGGSLQPMIELVCKADLTDERTKLIASYLECRDNGCPY